MSSFGFYCQRQVIFIIPPALELKHKMYGSPIGHQTPSEQCDQLTHVCDWVFSAFMVLFSL